MDLNLRVLNQVTGILLLVSGCSMILPALVAVIYGETSCLLAFVKVLIPSVLTGAILVIFARPKNVHMRMRDGFLIVSVCWLLLSLIGALPFVISGSIPNYIDAFFETCSGYSTTGATILTDIESLPRSMLFWRSFTHWIGGMGVLVLAVALLPALGIGGQFIAKAESPGPTLSKLTPKISDTARLFYILYLVFTVIEIILLLMGGVNIYDACIHTFGTVGTGGFSSYNAGVAAFDSLYVEIILTIFMFVSGASYYLYFLALQNGVRNFLRDSEFKLYFLIFAVSSVLIAAALLLDGNYATFGEALRYSSFQSVSILTTTGFATADYIFWPTFCQIMLLLLFFIGGCSSSTAGGIKVIRIFVLMKLIKRTIGMKLHPSAVVTVKVNGNKILPGDTVSGIASFVFLYICLIFAGSILLSLENIDLLTCFSATASCLGNIGPAFGEAGPMLNYNFFSEGSKLLLSFMMIAGRLELFTLIMLFSRKFWNPYH